MACEEWGGEREGGGDGNVGRKEGKREERAAVSGSSVYGPESLLTMLGEWVRVFVS